MPALIRFDGSVTASLRLPHVYGAHSLLFDQVRHGRIFFPGRGDNRFVHLHVRDAARALIRAARIGLEGCRAVPHPISVTACRRSAPMAMRWGQCRSAAVKSVMDTRAARSAGSREKASRAMR